MVAGSRNLLIEKILGLRWLDLNQRVFGREPKGWFLSRAGNRSEHFRCCFARGILGTQCMRSHICLHHATTKYFSNSFVFKNKIEKEGLPRHSRLAWAQGGPSSNLGAPTIYFFVFNAMFLMLAASETWVQIQASPRLLLHHAALSESRANKFRA